MFNNTYAAIVIVSDNLSFVKSVHCQLELKRVNCLIERSFGAADFNVLIEELIKEKFNTIEVISDHTIQMDEFEKITQIIKSNMHKINKLALIDFTLK
ncbi:MAG: hypothetical protein K9G36_11470 [Crocinitomicaceae bacterium]|nr:hypothetical protein [Crocinitomicaceae bacterium]MCF8410736.1 hypothetical protein [Crocinitomicaceae bacterium]MCF8444185.1 hypothetical protein [Crocinitomicaceae bacterium]